MANGSRQAAWEFFGAELKRRREESGLTQSALGMRVFVSGGYIGQFEQAIRKPQLDVAQRIDEVLQTGGFFERLCRKLIAETRYAEYFAHVAELEGLATEISDFAPAVVPGLLQTAEYARGVFLASHPFASDDFVEERVRARMDRASVIKDVPRPTYWAILHETVLYTPVGTSDAMARQLEHITAMANERKAMVQVLPFAAGAYPNMGKMLKTMEFDDAPPTAYTEGVLSGTLLDDPAMVKQVQGTYDLLRAAALSPEASLALIESAAEDYRRCISTT
ncbi:helix-turn-helix domain-containing protein [Streptomyces alfalfae]|uniref:Helix-turn-helix transcriptional regulator n=1 Tax=Streptomyces alfalfae TaxID=1642299 RepID=A0A7T4TXQ5_9ACTN|nr:helix-turn-helix transcriptional regulator [Streptomyces alfalfae]QQC89195.1 helix-turn-helix transcriptional regulator [Streptomyces alfalfae]